MTLREIIQSQIEAKTAELIASPIGQELEVLKADMASFETWLESDIESLKNTFASISKYLG